jgi:dolichol kinase
MADAGLAALWVAILGAGVLAAAGLRLLGLARTHVRDVLHVGAGVWPLGWPFWHGTTAPLAIVWGACVAVAALPALAQHSRLLARLRDGVSSEEEKWSGLVLYTLAAAVLTTVGLLQAPFPAAGALLALALGDGLGGALGLAFGRHRFRAPGGKAKSLEGSLAVALFSALGVALAAAWFSVPVAWGVCGLAGLVAAVAEALSPRATDNLVLPACVFGLLAFA